MSFDNALLRDMHVFVAVARARSFRKAAEALRTPASTVSRRVAALERAIGVRLVNRTTRSVALTDVGEAYYARARDIMAQAEAAHEIIRSDLARPQGVLRIAMRELMITDLALPWIMEFLALYPDVRIDLAASPELIDPNQDNFDICVRDDEIPVSALRVRRLGTFRQALFASRDYVARLGSPTHPFELADGHDCVRVGSATDSDIWRLRRGATHFHTRIGGRVTVPTVGLCTAMIRAGQGIGPIIARWVGGQPWADELVEVLPDWELDPIVVSALTTSTLLPARTRSFMDFFAARMAEFERRYG